MSPAAGEGGGGRSQGCADRNQYRHDGALASNGHVHPFLVVGGHTTIDLWSTLRSLAAPTCPRVPSARGGFVGTRADARPQGLRRAAPMIDITPDGTTARSGGSTTVSVSGTERTSNGQERVAPLIADMADLRRRRYGS
jgi:hypothetical protein